MDCSIQKLTVGPCIVTNTLYTHDHLLNARLVLRGFGHIWYMIMSSKRGYIFASYNRVYVDSVAILTIIHIP